MAENATCGNCGTALAPAATICRECGWDLTVAATRPMKRSFSMILFATTWRIVVYGLIVLIPVLAFARLQATGPGPDLETTIRWMIHGDDGRAAELVTIHRAYETSVAASRYAIRELESVDFEGEWGDTLRPYSTIYVRGWVPMLLMSTDTAMAPASVKTFYEVREIDGWSNTYKVSTHALTRGSAWQNDPTVARDLEAGLRTSFFKVGEPDFEDGEWMRLELRSGGLDGSFDTEDDLVFVSYMKVGLTIHLQFDQERIRREIEVTYTTGKHFFHLEGNRFKLLDARRLAEFREETIS